MTSITRFRSVAIIAKTLQTLPIWLQVLVGIGYGSVMGLAAGKLFSVVIWGGIFVLSRMIYAIAFAN